jgi:hypothetical protein
MTAETRATRGGASLMAESRRQPHQLMAANASHSSSKQECSPTNGRLISLSPSSSPVSFAEGSPASSACSGVAASSCPAPTFFYVRDESEGEPCEVPLSDLAGLREAGAIDDYSLVWMDGMEEWCALADPRVASLFDFEARERGGSAAGTESGSEDEEHSSSGSSSPAVCYDRLRYVIERRGDEGDEGDDTPAGLEMSDEISVAELRGLLAEDEVGAQTLVWAQGMSDWAPLHEAHALFGLARAELRLLRAQGQEAIDSLEGAVSGAPVSTLGCRLPNTCVRCFLTGRMGWAAGTQEPLAGTDGWVRVHPDDGGEPYFLQPATGQSCWELSPQTQRQAAEARCVLQLVPTSGGKRLARCAAVCVCVCVLTTSTACASMNTSQGRARPSGSSWLQRENAALVADNQRLRVECAEAKLQLGAARRELVRGERKSHTHYPRAVCHRGGVCPTRDVSTRSVGRGGTRGTDARAAVVAGALAERAHAAARHAPASSQATVAMPR